MESGVKIPAGNGNKGGLSLPRVLLVVLVTVLVTLGGSYWFLKTYVFMREFKPVELSAKEQQLLDSKLRTLGFSPKKVESDKPAVTRGVRWPRCSQTGTL